MQDHRFHRTRDERADEKRVEQRLREETLRSEQLRMAIVAGVVAVQLVLFLTTYLLLHDYSARIFHNHLSIPWVVGICGAIIVYELTVRFVSGRLVVRMHSILTPARIGNTFVESTIPTVFIVAASGVFGPVDALDLPPLLIYALFIILSVMRLDFTLCFLAGLVAGIEYVGVALFMLHGVQSGGTTILTDPIQFGIKGFLFVVMGILAGVVSVQLRRQLMRTLLSVEDRNRIVGMFGQHVSPAVVDRLLSQNLDLGGEVRHVCLMFLDIRNFTAYTEKEDPVAVVAYLNSLFEFMIDSVNRHQGIVNKFLGDGFMAVFGAPIPDSQNCQHAIDASVEILGRLAEFNATGGASPTRIGIGLHAGEAVTGNVGSAQRKEYTIIGDTVNVASRIEQLNKSHDSQLLVSDAVWRKLQNVPDSGRSLGPVAVRGHEAPIELFQVG